MRIRANSLRTNWIITLVLCTALSSVVHAASSPVEGRVTRVGLFAGADPMIRRGAWTFAEVELRYRGTRPFDGQLRVEQSDNDGDVVSFIEPVALAPGGDWRPYQIYFVPNQVTDSGGVPVKLFDALGEQILLVDDTGKEIGDLYCPLATELPPDEVLVVDLTAPRRLPHLTALDMDARRQRGEFSARKVRALTPRELPMRAQGLDAVDAIVWDDADPSQLSRPQIDALVEWTLSGGRLLISAGRNWQALTGSGLATLLPVTIRGVAQQSEAQEFLDIVENDRYAGLLDRHYAKNPITRCQMNPLHDAVPVPATCPHPQICWRRMIGRGSVTFLGASIRELMPAPSILEEKLNEETGEFEGSAATERFVDVACEKVIARRLLALPAVQKQEINMLMTSPTDLFQLLRGSIAFESVGTRFLIFAVLFAVAYSLAATIGSYWYLKRKSWLQHSWSAFGIISITGSLLGTGMVGLLRGVTTKLWQTTIVDTQSGVSRGEAACLLGVKTPNHTRLNLVLPQQNTGEAEDRAGSICGMPGAESFEVAETQFAAAAKYESLRAGEFLERVPIRATLKEFLGNWSGPLTGAIEGKLVTRKSQDPKDTLEYEFAPGSFIRNGLGTPLKDCYLLMTREEMAGEARIVLSHCFFIGDLPAEGAGARLGDADLRRLLLYQKDPDKPDDPAKRIPRLPLLTDVMKNWAGQLRNLRFIGGDPDVPPLRLTGDQEYVSVLMLSFYDLIRLENSKTVDFRRSHGRRLGCAHQLTKRTALLIGQTESPAPAVLHHNGDPLLPSKSRTIYRVVLPVERL